MSEASQGERPTPQEFERVLAAAATAQASFEEEHLAFGKRVQRFLHLYPTVVPFVVLLLGLLLGVTVNFSHFVTGSNLSTVLTQVTIVGFLGIAQTLVILTAGIDLSVGVIMVICSVVMGRLAVVDGVTLFIAFPAGLLCGIACGYLNGTLVTRLQMPPFIVTLGTLSIIGALNTFYSQSETIREQDISDQAPFLQSMGIPFEIVRRAHHSGELPPHRCWRSSSGTSSTAPPMAAMSTRPATIPRRRAWPASTPIASCSASMSWPDSSPRSPAGC